jgi:hypothetical protein
MQTSTDNLKRQVGSYPKIASELSGVSCDPDKWEKGKSQNQKLLDQSYLIADKMHGVKYQVEGKTETFRAYDESQDLHLFGLYSKEYVKLPNFRPIGIIPHVARKKRNNASKELEYFLDNNQNCRTWTMTTGKRCSIVELPQRLEWLHAKFGRVNQQPFMKKLGAKFVFRATEFGEIAQSDDGLSFHPHTHALLCMDRKLNKYDWATLLCKIKTYFVYHSQDCGRIRNAREMVKYCAKPSDLEHLTGQELIALHGIIRSKRMYEFLGQLRTQRQMHKRENLRLIRRKGKLRTTRNWVGGVKEKLPRWVHNPEESDARPTLVAWCPPSSIFTHVTEPCFIIHALGKNDPSSVFKWMEVKQMEAHIRVHTKTLTHHMRNREKEINNESKSKIFEKDSRSEGISSTRRKPDKVVC